MPRLTVDNMPVEVPEGSTILDAAAKLGIDIPTLCFLDRCDAETSCMVCVVKIEGRRGLLPACATLAAEGMVVASDCDEVRAIRREALELLLSDHLGDCVAPCEAACPARMNIPLMIRHIIAGRAAEAFATARDRIALPGVMGRICDAPCEKACRRGRLDAPVAICLLKRFAADSAMLDGGALPAKRPATGESVAVVGAGPAGLAAADYLLRLGHACTIFDENDQPGGSLRHLAAGVLTPDVLTAEIGGVEALDAQMRMGVRVGRDMSLAELQQQFGAIIVATGPVSDDAPPLDGLRRGKAGIEADRNTFRTSIDGVFAAGDAVGATAQPIRALASGRRAAVAVDQFLAGRPVTGEPRPFSTHMGKLMDGEMELLMAGVSDAPPAAGSPEGFSTAHAVDEARRCMHCDCRAADACKLRDWSCALGASAGRYRGERRMFEQYSHHDLVIYEPGKCIACGLCIQIARQWDEPLGLTFVGRGFDIRVAVPLSQSLADGLKTAAVQCAAACPTGALAMKGQESVGANDLPPG